MVCDNWLTSRSEVEDGAAAGKDRCRRDMKGSDELEELEELDVDILASSIVLGKVMRRKGVDCVLRGRGSSERT